MLSSSHTQWSDDDDADIRQTGNDDDNAISEDFHSGMATVLEEGRTTTLEDARDETSQLVRALAEERQLQFRRQASNEDRDEKDNALRKIRSVGDNIATLQAIFDAQQDVIDHQDQMIASLKWERRWAVAKHGWLEHLTTTQYVNTSHDAETFVWLAPNVSQSLEVCEREELWSPIFTSSVFLYSFKMKLVLWRQGNGGAASCGVMLVEGPSDGLALWPCDVLLTLRVCNETSVIKERYLQTDQEPDDVIRVSFTRPSSASPQKARGWQNVLEWPEPAKLFTVLLPNGALQLQLHMCRPQHCVAEAQCVIA